MTPTTQQQVWDWLKAEARYRVGVRRWLRQEGVSEQVLTLRRMGKPEQPRSSNRAARRRMRKLVRIK